MSHAFPHDLPADTGQKPTEDALRQSERRYRYLFESIDEGFCVIELLYDGTGKANDWRFLEVNSAFERHNGLVQAVGKTIRELVPDIEGRWFNLYGEVVSTGQPMRLVEYSEALSRWFSLYAFRVDEPGQHRLAVLFTDITAQKRAEEASRESEMRYRTLFESIDEGFCVIEVIFDENEKPLDYRFLTTNPAFERQTGLKNAEGKRMRELAPKHEDYWFEIYGRIAKTGESCRFQNPAEQLHRWYDVYAFRYGDPAKRQVGILFNDILDRKKTEETLIRSEKLAATGRMAATIAHEINNPLAAAVNAVYLAAQDPESSPRVRELLTIADQELRRAAHITQQTLGFYRDNGNRSPVPLPKLIEDVIRIYERKLIERGITVQCRYNCGPCAEDCDRCFLVNEGEMRQVLSNLVANGMDALRDQGKLHVRVLRLAERNGKGQRIRLTIADNGTGIRKQDLKRIFEPFFTTKKSVGTGLGLWVIQELVRKHGGSIRVRSCAGKGSVFQLEIPANVLSNSARAPAKPVVITRTLPAAS